MAFLYTVDAFTDRPFAGNPAAVCLLGSWPSDNWMRRFAAEMNLSETAFVVPRGEGFELRWFTPTTEVDLCGHATLAAAFVLWEEGMISRTKTIAFSTASGTLECRAHGSWVEMNFPAEAAKKVRTPGMLRVALGGVDPEWVGRNRMDWLVLLANEHQVEKLEPNLELLSRLGGRGVIVTAQALPNDRGVDVVSRFFAPRAGIDEDPVTGSAHCALAPFWSELLDRKEFTAEQRSARGGTLRVEHHGERVTLLGQAVMVSRGDVKVPITLPEDEAEEAQAVAEQETNEEAASEEDARKDWFLT